MPTPIDWPRWKLYQRQIEAALREGYAPPGVAGGKGSVLEACERRLIASGKLVISPKTRGRLAKWAEIQRRRRIRGQDHCEPDWALFQRVRAAPTAAGSRVVERHVLTAAQNDTPVHGPFLTNLKAYCAYVGARLHIGRFTYQVARAGDRARKEGEATRERAHTWAKELADYLTSERIQFGDLLFCAEMNTLPTAERPLSGLHTYGQGKTAIFPHAKVALETVPTGGDGLPPVVLSTGACTVPSYSDTKAGHKGEFHHVLGSVVVEVDSANRTWFRHLLGKQDGSFQDLDIAVANGRARAGHSVEAITYGDLQLPFLDPEVAAATWGIDADTCQPIESGEAMIDALRPRYGFYHDTIDFKSISHHDEKSPRERFRVFVEGQHLVEAEFHRAARFLAAAGRDFQRAVIVQSNHDIWIDRWLDRFDHRRDRANALMFLRLETARMEAEARGESGFNVFRSALADACGGDLPADFVPEGGSYVICQGAGGIECGQHGHLGPNGGAASPRALARVSGKATVGDKHSPAIVDGLYVAGTSSLLRLGYNKGPSSWRHAHVVTYANGKRTLVFLQGGRWRA